MRLLHIFHKWTKWEIKKLRVMHDDGNIYQDGQTRECQICGKIEVRRFKV